MIHRSRRHLATLPARRGMRASWLRCRVPEELEAAPGAEPDAPTEPATPAEEPATGPSGAAAVSPGAAAAPAPARAAFGHPTF